MTGLRPSKTASHKFFQALYPRERWTPSEWAEQCRVLSAEESSEPGPYSLDRTPYWRAVLDAAVRPGVEEIVCLKGAQIGWSEVCRNLMGYWVDLDPGPILVLMPDQKSAEDFREERIEPLIKHTQAVSRHVSSRAWDSTKHRIKFDTCSVFFAWAGSKTGTKSRPIRRLVCEEPDEYPPFSSTGGDPLSKAEKRLTTYRDKGRSLVLLGGTPTTRTGNIWKRWERCSVRYQYWVPCPQCSQYQILRWKQVRWPDRGDADRADHAEQIKTGNLAWYECENPDCKCRILDHHKPRMLRRGVWATEDQVVTRDGRVVGADTKAKRIGFHVSGLYSPWVTFSHLAGEWLECQDDPQSLCDFVNQRLAEPFEEQRAKTEPEFIRDKATGAPPPLIVPGWTRALISTADTQGSNEQDGYFWYVTRAWGLGYRSQLVDFGVASSREELIDRTLDRQFSIDGTSDVVTPQNLFVDSGGPRWSEVYEMAQGDPRIHPTKGASQSRTWMVEEKPQRAHDIVLWTIDTEQAKDLLHRLIHDPDKTKWLPHRDINDDYCRQMVAEAKVFDPQANRERWTEMVKNMNHLWDCEAMQAAVAWRMGMGIPEPPEETQQPVNPQRPTGQPSDWVNDYKGRY